MVKGPLPQLPLLQNMITVWLLLAHTGLFKQLRSKHNTSLQHGMCMTQTQHTFRVQQAASTVSKACERLSLESYANAAKGTRNLASRSCPQRYVDI